MKNGNTVIFKGLEGSSTAAWKQWHENFPILQNLLEGLSLDEAKEEIELEMKNESALDEKFVTEMKYVKVKNDSDGPSFINKLDTLIQNRILV